MGASSATVAGALASGYGKKYGARDASKASTMEAGAISMGFRTMKASPVSIGYISLMCHYDTFRFNYGVLIRPSSPTLGMYRHIQVMRLLLAAHGLGDDHRSGNAATAGMRTDKVD